MGFDKVIIRGKTTTSTIWSRSTSTLISHTTTTKPSRLLSALAILEQDLAPDHSDEAEARNNLAGLMKSKEDQ